jgi:[ribosomal protein S5]-alanine N-acetyltransferase
LSGDRVVLRAPRLEDVADRLAAGRGPEFRRMVGATGPGGPFRRADAERWCAALTAEAYGWVIEHDGRCVGEARLHGLNPTTPSRRDRAHAA